MDSDGKATLSSNRESTRKTSDASLTVGKPNDPSACSNKTHGKGVASSDVLRKPIEKLSPASAIALKRSEQSGSLAIATRRPRKEVISAASGIQTMVFRDVTLGPHEAELVFRLVHFWEARNPQTKVLIGEELLLIDEEGNVIQEFIPASRVDTFLPDLVAGAVYRLSNFFRSKSKEVFRVADHSVTVSFSWNTRLSVLKSIPDHFPQDHFRFHGHEEFQANCDQKGDLYDYLGHMKLVNGHVMDDHPVLDEASIAETCHVLIRVQSHDGPVMKFYLWEKAARDFCQKFKSHGGNPRVVLITTVNPKRLGGTVSLGSMSSSRVFMDTDVEPTREYLTWLRSNLDIANRVNAEVVTKPETVTLEDLYSYIKQEVAWFECVATIDDILRGSAWYYISCGGCNTKASKGPTSLTCNNPKCTKKEVVGVAQYLTRIYVYDKSEQAVFILLGDAGRELTGKHASELVASHFEGNEDIGGDAAVPVPQSLLDPIGETRRFVVKVSEHNMTGKTQTITITKVLPAEPSPPPTQTEGHTGGDSNPSSNSRVTATNRNRKASQELETDAAKRNKSS